MCQEGSYVVMLFSKVILWIYSRSLSGEINFIRVLCEHTLKSVKIHRL